MSPPDDAFARWVSVGSDLGVGIGALLAVIVAWKALNTWKRQLLGESRHERAEAVLDDAHRVRAAVYQVRALFMGPALPHYQQRLVEIREALDALEISIRRARIYWGDELEPHRELLKRGTDRIYAVVARMRMAEEGLVDPLATTASQSAEHFMALYGIVPEGGQDEIMALVESGIGGFERSLASATGNAGKRPKRDGPSLPWRRRSKRNS